MSKNTVKPGLTSRRRNRRARNRMWVRVVRLVFRFLTGRPLDGRRHCNGSFWRRGTRRVGYPPYLITWGWWNLAAGWQRATIRLSALLLTVLAVRILLGVVA
ncbi:hypothetical protein RB614_37535 [Phytohabitans sp. ZYX-F-186]|uniref:Uncharacterized protein n=1 Tax=Phytohabitans maris TaxID=3071409 RepID=A0ABU0ZT47_9ACTN|nr:hypothetical protein [Phytohabitans sp. ZYX-F-186]MDQ7910214.1 hypothetical protein [Phytohabitans sp. ZYX-F-186]